MENVKAIKESVLGLGCWWDVGCREKGEGSPADQQPHRAHAAALPPDKNSSTVLFVWGDF